MLLLAGQLVGGLLNYVLTLSLLLGSTRCILPRTRNVEEALLHNSSASKSLIDFLIHSVAACEFIQQKITSVASTKNSDHKSLLAPSVLRTYQDARIFGVPLIVKLGVLTFKDLEDLFQLTP